MINFMILKKKNKLIKNLTKTPKKTETNDMKEFNKLINNEEMDKNKELFQDVFLMNLNVSYETKQSTYCRCF